MKRSHLLALLLALASGAFLLFGFFEQILGWGVIVTMGAATFVLLGASVRRPRRDWRRWIIVGASTVYSLLLIAALGAAYNQQLPIGIRSALSAFLMLGLLLSLRCLFQATRQTRYGFHNYFDS